MTKEAYTKEINEKCKDLLMWIDTKGIEKAEGLTDVLTKEEYTNVIAAENPGFLTEMRNLLRRNHSWWAGCKNKARTEVDLHRKDSKVMWKKLSYVQKHGVYTTGIKRLALQHASNIYSKAKYGEQDRKRCFMNTLIHYYNNREKELEFALTVTKAMEKEHEEMNDAEYTFITKLMELENLYNAVEQENKCEWKEDMIDTKYDQTERGTDLHNIDPRYEDSGKGVETSKNASGY